MNQQLDYHWDSDVSKLIVLQFVYIFSDKGANRHLKLVFLFFLLLGHVLSLQIHAIAQKRWPPLHYFWKLGTNLFWDKSNEVFDGYFQMIKELCTVLDGTVATGEYTIDRSEAKIVVGFDIEGGLNEYKLP